MKIIQGSANIPSGSSNSSGSWSIVFPGGSFVATPTVLVEVQNTDPTNGGLAKQRLTAFVYAVSSTGFDVVLSGTTNTAFYTLAWVAIQEDSNNTTLSGGRRISELDAGTPSLAGLSWVLGVAMSPSPNTLKVPIEAFKNTFPVVVPYPAAYTDAGVVGQVAFSPTHFFWHDGTRWQRIAVDTWS